MVWKFADDSVSELDFATPFRSLALALQPPGAKPPSDEEIRKMVAPLAAANDVQARRRCGAAFEHS